MKNHLFSENNASKFGRYDIQRVIFSESNMKNLYQIVFTKFNKQIFNKQRLTSYQIRSNIEIR